MRRFKSIFEQSELLDRAQTPPGGFLLQPVDFALQRRALPVVPEQAQRPDALVGLGRDGPDRRAMPVTSAHSPSFRRSKSADRHLFRLSPRAGARASLEDPPRRQARPNPRRRAARGRPAPAAGSCTSAQIRPRSAGLMRASDRQFPLGERRLLRHGRLADLRPHDLFGNAGLVGQPIRELIAGGGIGDAGRDRQHLLQERPTSLVGTQVVLPGGAVEQEFQVRLRVPQRSWYASRPWRPDERVRILARAAAARRSR